MKKLFICIGICLLLSGCGKTSKDSLIKDFVNKVESSKSYYTEAKMEIVNNDDTYNYDMKVYYKDDNYFKVDMLNTTNNHQQFILRDEESVYVVTPSLNKSYKFQSEWPYNSSQSYILSSIVRDIKDDTEVEYESKDDGYYITVDVKYPNNSNLKYEVIYFNKSKDLKRVSVYDSDDAIAIDVNFKKIDYKANLSDEEFSVEGLIDEDCCKVEDDTPTSSLEDIIYPLYIPNNTFLKNKEVINVENGERAILTFNGDKNFVLIEEVSNVNEEFEIIPVYGEPLMVSNTIGALGNNSLSWSSNNVDYYLASNDLTTEELVSIASSLNVVGYVEK